MDGPSKELFVCNINGETKLFFVIKNGESRTHAALKILGALLMLEGSPAVEPWGLHRKYKADVYTQGVWCEAGVVGRKKLISLASKRDLKRILVMKKGSESAKSAWGLVCKDSAAFGKIEVYGWEKDGVERLAEGLQRQNEISFSHLLSGLKINLNGESFDIGCQIFSSDTQK